MIKILISTILILSGVLIGYLLPKEQIGIGIPDLEKETIISTEIATSTISRTFEYKNTSTTISISFDGYNDCRKGVWGTSTQAFCKAMLKEQIELNIKWAKQGIDAQTEKVDYSQEVQLKDL